MNARGCTGGCNQGDSTCDCELASAHAPRLELVRSVPSRPPIQVSGGRVPLRRRARRFMRALWEFFSASCFEP